MSWVKVCALILLTATAVVAPLIFFEYYPGDDLYAHVSLWFETSRQWREGIAYPRWAGLAMFGYGEPSLLFYPPVSRILGGTLVSCLPSRMALGAYGWIGLALGGFSFFYLCRAFLGDHSSLVGAFAYVINPYNLYLLYFSCTLAEFLAAALFPFFVLAVLRLGEKGIRSTAALALMTALLWLTDVPAAVVANYTAAAVIIALALVRRSKSLLFFFVLAEALGAGLAAFYLFPAWHQQPLIDVAGAIFSSDPLQSFLLVGGWYKHTLRSPLVILNVGFPWQVLVSGVAWLYARKFRSEQPVIAIALAMILMVSILMCLPASAPVWKYAPFLPYVQFPFRWLVPLNLAAVFFIAAALRQNGRRSWLTVAAFTYSLFFILSFSCLRNQVLRWEEFAAPFLSGAGTEETDDYIPLAVGNLKELGSLMRQWPSPRVLFLDRDEKDQASAAREERLPIATNGTGVISIRSWQTESRVFTVDSPEPVRVRVRLLYYPGWHVFVNGHEITRVEVDGHDAVVVRIPSGHNTVRLEFKTTPDEIWGGIISGVMAFLVSALFLIRPAVPDRAPS